EKSLIQLQYSHKCRLRDLYVTYLAHSLLSFLLFLKKLAFTRDIASVTLGGNIFTHGFYRFPGNDLGSDRGLDNDLDLRARDRLAQLFTDLFPEVIGVGTVDQ